MHEPPQPLDFDKLRYLKRGAVTWSVVRIAHGARSVMEGPRPTPDAAT